MEDIRKRINKALEIKGVSAYSLAERGTTLESKLGSQIKRGTAKITLETLMVVINRFPDLNLNWLLRGEGTEPFITIHSNLEQAEQLLAENKAKLDALKKDLNTAKKASKGV